MSVTIQSFSNADKVPGPYGEVVYGAGGQTSGSIPLVLLLVGLATGGAITPDSQIVPVNSLSDIDYFAGAGSELATMAYDALATEQDVQIFLGAPTAPGGAVAATLTLTIAFTSGSAPTTGGQIIVRIGGEPVVANYSTTDTASSIATAVAAAINGQDDGRLAVTASASGAVVTISRRTPGIRGNQSVIFVDPETTRGNNVAAYLGGSPWNVGTTYAVGNTVINATAGFYYVVSAITTGTSIAGPSGTTIGATVTDGGVTWKCIGTVVTGGGCTMSQGSGLETYTNLLGTIVNRQFDRIGLAPNDSVSLALWNTQISSTDPAATVGILQHAVVSTSGSLSAAQSLTQTTLNAQRFQLVWQQNSETPPWRMSAAIACERAAAETNDPATDYDGVEFATITPQSQQADWATHAVLVSALNTGVSPLFTYGTGGGALMCRSITTHCLNGSNPDYSTLDTAEAVVPDFVCQYLKTYFTTVYQKANKRVQPDPSADDPLPVTGVGYPANFNSCVLSRLQQMEGGKIPGTCPPIITNVAENMPVSDWNPVGERIMTAVPTQVARGNHQVGLSIRQV